jgi:uncharacterized protein YdaU (DUF1376 family)
VNADRLPWMQFYVDDFLGGTALWGGPERGLYALLLIMQWASGPLPADAVKLAQVVGYELNAFRSIWKTVSAKYQLTDQGLINRRLEEHRAESLQRKILRSASGKTGAEARWGKDGNRNGDRNGKRTSKRNGEANGKQHGKTMPSTSTSTSTSTSRSYSPLRGAPVRSGPDSGAVRRVFDHWRGAWNHPRAQLDAKRRRTIAAALKIFDEAELRRSIDGYRFSPHHCGQNDKRTQYDDIELFLRDAKHVETGLQFGLGAANGKPPPASMTAAVREQLAKFVESKRRIVRTVDEIIRSTPEPLRKQGWEEAVKSSYDNRAGTLQ